MTTLSLIHSQVSSWHCLWFLAKCCHNTVSDSYSSIVTTLSPIPSHQLYCFLWWVSRYDIHVVLLVPLSTRNILDDFREAYYWLRQNTAEDATVMSWWDYGYQIAGMANRTTLVDNNTWNNSHIALVSDGIPENSWVASVQGLGL